MQILAALKIILTHSRSNEPGVIKYCITTPQPGEPHHDADIVMIEEYADSSAHEAHLASQPVQELFALFKSSPSPLSSPVEIYQLQPSTSFTRLEVDSNPNPMIIFASFGYQEGKTARELVHQYPSRLRTDSL